MINIIKIKECEFNLLNHELLFSKPEFNRSFALVKIETYIYKTAWNSTVIQPQLLDLDLKFFAIDQFLAIFNHKGCLLKKQELSYRFCDFLYFNNTYYIITELDICKIDLNNYDLIEIEYFNEIYSHYKISNNKLTIFFIDGQSVQIAQTT
jgi:hypothetical protein